MNKFRFPVLAGLAFVLFIFSALFGFFLLWPEYVNFRNIRQSMDVKKEEIKQKEEYFSKLRQTKEDLRKYESELVKIDASLPKEINIPELFQFFQQISSQSGMVLKTISHSAIEPNEEKNLKEIEFVLGLEGPYDTFKGFLAALEKSARMIETQSVSFSSAGQGALFNFNMKIKTSGY